MVSREKQIEEFPKRENLGHYHVEGVLIDADLDLEVILDFDSGKPWGRDIYSAVFLFYTTQNKYGELVKFQSSGDKLDKLFSRVKRAEEGIEQMLALQRHHDWSVDWRGGNRDVMKAIFSFEEQTRELYNERIMATKEREIAYKKSHGLI